MRIEWTEESSAELDHMLAYIAAQDTSAAALIRGDVIWIVAAWHTSRDHEAKPIRS